MTENKVVVTGIGIVSAFGIGKDALWSWVCNPQPREDEHARPTRQVGDFDLFGLTQLQESAHTRHMDRYSKYAVLAAKLALDDSGLIIDEGNAERVGLVFGSDYGCLNSNYQFIGDMNTKGVRLVSPVVFQNTVSNTVNGYSSILLGIKGPNTALSDSVSGYLALCYGHDLVRSGKADVVLAGGIEELCPPLAANARFRESAVGWRLPRTNEVLSDGAAILVLESRESATRRRASVYADFTGHARTPSADSKQSLEQHLRQSFRSILEDLDSPPGSVKSMFFESEKGADVAKELLRGAGRSVAFAIPNQVLGPTLGNTFTPALCLLSLRAAAIPPAMNVAGRGSAVGAAGGAGGCSLVSKVDDNGSIVALAFEPVALD